MPALRKQVRMPEDIREVNTRLILNQFMNNDSLIISRLEQTMGISKTTIIKIVAQLVECGLLVDCGKTEPSQEKGRRPNVYSLNSKYRYLISTQMFPTELYTIVTDLRNVIQCSHSTPLDAATSLDQLIGAILDSVTAVMTKLGIGFDRVEGLCVASSGPTNFQTGTVIYAPRFPGLPRHTPLREELERRLPKGVAVFVENEMRLQALAEQHLGRTSSLNLVFEAGDKLVAGLVDKNGDLIRGSHSTAGEIGHITLDPNSNVRCVCGACGCFLALVSEKRAVTMANTLLGEFPHSALHKLRRPIVTEDVFRGFAKHDPLCEYILDDIARWFGIGIANIILMFDPESIVIQGIYTKAGPLFLEKMRRYTVQGKYPLLSELDSASIEFSTLDKDAGVLGGSIMLTQYFLSHFTV